MRTISERLKVQVLHNRFMSFIDSKDKYRWSYTSLRWFVSLQWVRICGRYLLLDCCTFRDEWSQSLIPDTFRLILTENKAWAASQYSCNNLYFVFPPKKHSVMSCKRLREVTETGHLSAPPPLTANPRIYPHLLHVLIFKSSFLVFQLGELTFSVDQEPAETWFNTGLDNLTTSI